MLDKIRIERVINAMVEETVNTTLSLLPADSSVMYETEKAQFITNGIVDSDSLYHKEQIFDLEYKEGIEDLICALKKDFVSNHTMRIDISVEGEPCVVIDTQELLTFRNELERTEDKLWCEVYSKFKLAR